jgi:hypothetical protein
MSQREDRRLRQLAVKDSFRPPAAIGVDWVRDLRQRVSSRTIYRRIASSLLPPSGRLLLTQLHKAARLQWCQERQQIVG